MSGIETATDSLERHKHIQEHPEKRHARRSALMIGALAPAGGGGEVGRRGEKQSGI